MSVILFENLGFKIDQAWLLSEVNGTFASGKIHGIVGQNGAGKSTLLRCLTKQWQATTGEVYFLGQNVQNQNTQKQSIQNPEILKQNLKHLSYSELALQRAVLSQHQALAFSFTVEQLVRLGFESQQCPWHSSQLIAVLNATDIQHLQHRDVLSLSGGEQKRAQLARVLAQIWPEDSTQLNAFAGKWLFLDEWSEALDLKHQVQIGALLRQWANQGLGVVMVSHDLNQIMQLTDSCLLLKAGRRFSQGETALVMSAENLSNVLDIPVSVSQNQAGLTMVMPSTHDDKLE